MGDSKYDQQKEYHENAMLGLLVVVGVGAALIKYEGEIKSWLYDHMLMLIFLGVGFFASLGTYWSYRNQKKHEEYIRRAKGVNSLKSESRPTDYYRRRGDD
jgi:hypothetical protein